jgi:hypothetical protein
MIFFNKLGGNLLKLTTQCIKYLSKTNLMILNKSAENSKTDCVVCCEINECALKYCYYNQNIMCKTVV